MTNSPCWRIWLPWLTFPWLLAPLAAQGHGRSHDLIAVSAQARGLETIAGTLWASGAHYKARLSASGVCFVPALGRKSERPRELRFEMLASGRADGPMTVAANVTPECGDFAVHYRRGACTETYAVLAEGLEQSFVFHQRPAGSGDLVVRGRVHTDLPLSLGEGGSLRFVDARLGGVVLRDVVGIDAGGRRVAGSMRCLPDSSPGTWTLELSLPASFADEASLPLVLDPFIGTMLAPGAGPDDEYGDVAYEPTTDTWLFVWDRGFSMFNYDLVGQRFSGSGTPVGGLVTIRPGVNGLSRNRVVAVDARDTFVVAWYETFFQPEVWVASVAAATGAVNGPLLLGPGFDPDISVPTAQGTGVIAVWEDGVLSGIVATRVNIAPGGALSSGPVQQVSPAGIFPIAPRGGGTAGRMLVAWCRPGALHGAVLDQNAQVLAGGVLFANPATPNTVQLDGDDAQWIVAWSAGVGVNSDVHCRRITFDPISMTLAVGPQVAITNQPGVAEHNACVAWLGGVAAVGYLSTTGLGTANEISTPFVKTIDGFACTQCAPTASAGPLPTGAFAINGRLGARQGSNGVAAEAWFTCMTGAAGISMVCAWQFRSDDGLEWDRSGGCGGGRATHGCAVPGNSGYSFRLDSGPALVPAFVMLGTQAANLACGACTLVPDPATGAALYTGLTSTAGTASQALPVPASSSLTGFRYFGQWVTWSTGGCFGLATSNALEVQLQ